MGEADTIRGVWRTALAIIRKYPLAVFAPAAVLGALGEVPAYLIEGRPLLDQQTWGAWMGGSIVATLAMPLAAFATSLAHSSVARGA